MEVKMANYLIHNPKCSKSREALRLLEQNKVKFVTIEYLNGKLSKDLLGSLPNLLELDYLSFMRSKDDIYKELDKKYNFIKLTQEEIKEIIFKNPALLERPIFISNSRAIVGRPPEKILELI